MIGLIEKVDEIMQEDCFCDHGSNPQNKHEKCEFCGGSGKLAYGEKMRIAERFWEESR